MKAAKTILDYAFALAITLTSMLLIRALVERDWREAVRTAAVLGVTCCLWRGWHALDRAAVAWRDREVARLSGYRKKDQSSGGGMS